MRILIWGGTGFIGSQIVNSFIQNGHEVINVSREKSSDKKINTYTYDQKKEIIDCLKNCDGAVFAAGKRLTKEFGVNEYLDNMELITKVLDCLDISGMKNCIFLSTIGVYGDKGNDWSESDNFSPTNLYALSKKHQDEIVNFKNEFNGANYKILRLAQVMGVGERKGYLFNTFFDTVSKGKPVTVYGEGIGSRQYIYIKDIVNCVEKLLSFSSEAGIFNLGIKDSISILDLAKLMHNIFDIKQDIKFVEYKNEDKQIRKMNVNKIIEVFSFKPSYSMEEAIIDMKNDIEDEFK